MPLAPNSQNVYLGAGQILFARFVAGVEDDMFHLGNCSALSIEFADDQVEQKNSMNQSRGTYRKVNRGRTATVSITGHEYNADNMALIQMGTVGSLTQTAGSVTDEVLTASAVPGRYYQTAFREISSLVVNVSATPKTEGTDYVILDAFEGIIQVVEGGTISEGDQLDVDYDHAEIAAPGLQTVRGGASGVIEGRLRFLGDPTAGEVRNVDIWKVSLEPDSAIDLIGDDFGEWTLAAEILDDTENHPDAPFYEMLYTGEAR